MSTAEDSLVEFLAKSLASEPGQAWEIDRARDGTVWLCYDNTATDLNRVARELREYLTKIDGSRP